MAGNQTPGGGTRVGVASGAYRIDFSSLIAGRQTVASFARQTRADFEATGRSADQLAARMKNAATSIGGIVTTLGAGGIVRSGVQAAQQVNRINALMTIFSGSTQKAEQRMQELREVADRTGQSFLDVANGALAILPAVGRNNVELGKTLSIVQRLAVLDPVQGVEGAAFAVRELLGGDAKSLAGRFELPRQQLKKILDEAGGEPQKILDGLNQLIEGIGLTEDKFTAMGQNGAYAFQRLTGTVNEALATAFLPLLNNVLIPLARRFADFIDNLNRTNPQLLQVGSVFAIAAAAAAPLLLVLGQLITAYQTLQRVSATPIGRGVGRAAGVGLAVAGGVGLGIGAANLLARNTNLQTGDLNRIRQGEDAGAILNERIKQIVVIIVDGVIHLAKALITGGAFVANAIDQFVNVFRLAGAALGTAFGKLQEGIGNILVGLADALSGIFDTTGLRESGQFNQGQGIQRALDSATEGQRLAERLSQGFALSEETLADIDERIAFVRENVLGGLTNLLFPTEQAAEATENLASSADDASNALDAQTKAVLDNQQAIEETAGKVRDLNNEFAQETRRIQNERRIQNAREDFDRAQQSGRESADIALQRARENADLLNNLQRANQNFQAEMTELEANTYAQRLDLIQNFNREDERRAEDHGRRLEEIQRRTNAAVANAAARLDANAVFEALQSGVEQTDSANSQFNLETERRREDFNQQLTDLAANLQAQKNARVAAFNQQLIDEQAARDLRRQREDEDRAIRAQREQEDFDLRRQRQTEDYQRQDGERRRAHQRQISDLVSALSQETGIRYGWLSNLVSSLAAAGGHVANFANFVNQSMANLRGPQFGPQPPPGGNPLTGPLLLSQSGPQPPPAGNPLLSFPRFAGGGRPPLGRPIQGNELGMESALINGRYLAMFTQPAQIFPAHQTQQLLSGAGGGNFTTGDISLHFGDIGGHSPDGIKSMFYDALVEVARAARGQGGL